MDVFFPLLSDWLYSIQSVFPSSPLSRRKLMKKADSILLCKVVSFAYTSPLSIITFTPHPPFVCVCACVYSNCLPLPHLPSLTAPPAGICGDVQAPAAGLPGQKGELPHSAADEAPQVDGWRVAKGVRIWREPEQKKHHQHQQLPPEGEEYNHQTW